MSKVPVGGIINARPDGQFDQRLAARFSERLQALERALKEQQEQFTQPSLPAFGTGAVGATTVVVTGGGGTTTTVVQEPSLGRTFLLMGA